MKTLFSLVVVTFGFTISCAYAESPVANSAPKLVQKVEQSTHQTRKLASVPPSLPQNDIQPSLVKPAPLGFVGRIRSFFRSPSSVVRAEVSVGEDSNSGQPVSDLQREEPRPLSSEFQKISDAASDIDEATSSYSAVAGGK